MARKNDLTVVGYLDGVKLDGPIPKEKAERMMKRMGETMSRYYTQHPDEWAALCAELDRKDAERAQKEKSGA